MITIGFLGYSPASVNVLLPIIKSLSEENNLSLVTFQLSDFAKTHWEDLCTLAEWTEENLSTLDYMFYNTGSGGELETTVPQIGVKHGFKTVHIMDIYWGDALGMLKRFPINPDYSICITNKNKHDICKATGMASHRLFTYGNPHFDRLKKIKDEISVTNNNKRVSFISQCGMGPTYSEPTGDLPQEALLQLKDLLDNGSLTELKVYKHPRENVDFMNANGITHESTNEFTHMVDTDIIISCGSTPHYEAKMIGINTILFKEGTLLADKIKNKDFDILVQPSLDKDATLRVINWFKDVLKKDLIRKKTLETSN